MITLSDRELATVLASLRSDDARPLSALVPDWLAGSPEAVPGPVNYLEILDEGAAREIFLTWSAERRLLPATDLFRRHVLSRAAAGRLPVVSG